MTDLLSADSLRRRRYRPTTREVVKQGRLHDAFTADDTWRSEAVCRTLDPAVFYPDLEEPGYREKVEVAKAVCRGCPVRKDCLEFALAIGEADGVWGGASETERRRMSKRISGNLIRAAMACAGVGSEDVAGLFGVSPWTVRRWREGHLVLPSRVADWAQRVLRSAGEPHGR